MSVMLERRFERYCVSIMETLGHADRHAPAQWYLKGLLLPGDRKSVEPMAARVCPENVRSAHQSMHHLVAAADWDDGPGKQGTDHGFTGWGRRTTLRSPVLAFAMAVRISRGSHVFPA